MSLNLVVALYVIVGLVAIGAALAAIGWLLFDGRRQNIAAVKNAEKVLYNTSAMGTILAELQPMLADLRKELRDHHKYMRKKYHDTEG